MKKKQKTLHLLFFEVHVSGNQTISKRVGKYVNALEFFNISLAFLSDNSVRLKFVLFESNLAAPVGILILN